MINIPVLCSFIRFSRVVWARLLHICCPYPNFFILFFSFKVLPFYLASRPSTYLSIFSSSISFSVLLILIVASSATASIPFSPLSFFGCVLFGSLLQNEDEDGGRHRVEENEDDIKKSKQNKNLANSHFASLSLPSLSSFLSRSLFKTFLLNVCLYSLLCLSIENFLSCPSTHTLSLSHPHTYTQSHSQRESSW